MSLIKKLHRILQKKAAIKRCATCQREMQVIGFSGSGSVMLNGNKFASNIGTAEQCWECNRIYCDRCYPNRPPNTCVCGRGKGKVRHIGGVTYRGSLRLMKVKYLSC